MDGLIEHGLADQEEIDTLEPAWVSWADAADSSAAFAWGRATARRH
jgi:hypothetical protein